MRTECVVFPNRDSRPATLLWYNEGESKHLEP